ncbi:winged helix-turn-helix transcriptional regulator [Paenibacillus sp. FSL A5-0031]|uniref:winged helix-turn-helix transcriptional regulator n=1 Tax=Paenibacillus sp. FSL A5-0031 TaxID=1920420 RepID=UPI0009FA5D2B|nr:winged helix-turn-helix transcriptional regulator [Paenibacillus sp. FSL A5-0031]
MNEAALFGGLFSFLCRHSFWHHCELERDGVVQLEVDHEVITRVDYSRTNLGETLLPITQFMRYFVFLNLLYS